MNNNSSTLIKNIQELVYILDNDFDSYKNVLDQVVVETIKNSKHTDGLVTFINSQLSNAQSRRKGLILLNILLPLCPENFLEENAIAWLNNSLKNCQYEACINDEGYKVITALLAICHETPELNKCITSGIMSKLLEYITRIHFSNVETIHALKCLETCLRIYPGSCIPYKTTIEKFLLSFVDYTNSLIIIRLVGKCFHLFQQVGGGGAQGINYKENWKNQQLILCATMQSLMDNLFESIMEMGLVPEDVVSVLNLPTIPTGERMKLNSNRLINLTIFLQEMLLGAYPTVKCISPRVILNVISRGLAVAMSTLYKHILNEAINLATHLTFIHKHLLQLLQALIISLGCNLIPFAPTICKTVINNLKSTKSKDAENVKAFCDLRLNAYETLSLWMNVAKSSSCVHMYADTLIPIILSDVSPVTNQLNLTVQSTTPKHMSKKARKKLQQEKIIHSNVAKNYSRISKKTSVSSNIYQINICCEAFETLQTILLTSGHFLKPVVHKQLQEFIIRNLLNIQADVASNPYDAVNCKLSLYKTLTILVTNHHWNMSPPLNYAIHLLSKGQSDLDSDISSCCTLALSSLNSFIHPSCTTLQFPLNLESLKKEFNLEQDKTNEIEINSGDEDLEEMETIIIGEDIAITNKTDDDIKTIREDKRDEFLINDNESNPVTKSNQEKIVIEIEHVEEIPRKKAKTQLIEKEISKSNTEPKTKGQDISKINENEKMISKSNKTNKNDQEYFEICISDDDEEMVNLRIDSSPEIVIKDDFKPKTSNTLTEKTNEEVVVGDLLSSFVDIINE